MQGIVRSNLRVVLDPAAVQQQFQPLPRVQAEVVLAFRADVRVGFQVFFPDDGPAAGALGPQPFGLYAPLVGRRGLFNRFFRALEPGHTLLVSTRISVASVINSPLREQYLRGRRLHKNRREY